MSIGSFVFARMYNQLTRSMEMGGLMAWRAQLLAPVEGDVLEVGAGTGANLAHYGPGVRSIVATEPDPHMRPQLAKRAAGSGVLPVEIVDASAENLPVGNASVDALVSTLVLCSVPDQDRALAEYRRVLKPGGRLVFIEHVAARDRPDRLRWQRRVEPLWKRAFGNCHLTRDTEAAMTRAGFRFEAIDRESMRKAMPIVRPSIRGVARLA